MRSRAHSLDPSLPPILPQRPPRPISAPRRPRLVVGLNQITESKGEKRPLPLPLSLSLSLLSSNVDEKVGSSRLPAIPLFTVSPKHCFAVSSSFQGDYFEIGVVADLPSAPVSIFVQYLFSFSFFAFRRALLTVPTSFPPARAPAPSSAQLYYSCRVLRKQNVEMRRKGRKERRKDREKKRRNERSGRVEGEGGQRSQERKREGMPN